MIPYSALRDPVKHWTASLLLAEQVVALAGDLPRRSLGFGQPRGTCSLATQTFPDVAAGTAAKVLITLNGAYTTTFFTGRVDARPISDLPLSYELGLVDSLARLSVPLGTALTWNGQSFADGVRALLTRAGVANEEIGTIFSPGAAYTLGPIDPIVIPGARLVSEALSELLAYGGAGLFVLPDGTLTVVDQPGWPRPPDASTPVYAFGASGDEMGCFSARRTVVGAESVVATFTAKGPRLSTKRIADATFTVSGLSGKTVTETYPLLQTDACARAIAEREIVRRNRAATEVDVACPLNPNLQPGETVWFRHPELGFPSSTVASIIGIATSGDEMTMNLSVGAQPADGELSRIPPPAPAFTMRYEVQPVSLAGILATATVVEATNTSTDPSGLGITSLQWTAVCSGDRQPEPSSSSEPQPIFVFPTLEGAQLTLAVESSSGEGADLTRAISPPPAEIFTRALSVAAGGAGWRVLAGATGWRSFTTAGACTAVPGINDTGPLLAGFAGGELYRSSDYLASAPELLFTFPSAVGSIFVNEANPQEILVSAGTILARSSDGGLAWSPLAAFPADVQYAESSPANPGEIRVCAGGTLFLTMDGGASFTPLVSGPSGSIARKLASAPWGHLVVFSGTTNLADATQFEEGHSVDWSQVPLAHRPLDLASATPLQYEPGYLVAAGDAGDVVRDGLYAQLGYLANAGSTTKLYKLTPGGGGGFVATYLTTTVSGGPHKVVMGAGMAFPIDDGTEVDTAHRIGYGQAVNPARPPQLVVLPWSLSGTLDKLWHATPELGWTPRALPRAGVRWQGVDICPVNPNEWLIWDENYVYWTGTAGQTWAEIHLPHGVNILTGQYTLLGVGFSGKGRAWIISRFGARGFGTGRYYQSYVAFGEGPSNLRQRISGDGMLGQISTNAAVVQPVRSIARGYDGELWGIATAQQSAQGSSLGSDFVADYTRQVWVDPVGMAIHDAGATVYAPQAPTNPATGRAGYAIWSSNVAQTSNYRTSVADEATAIAAGTSVAVTTAGVFVGGREGIAELRPTLAGTELVVVAGGSYVMGPIATGSARRGAGALALTLTPSGTRVIFAHNGVQWTMTELPEGLISVCLQIGVVEP